jgi:hypothetical protein
MSKMRIYKSTAAEFVDDFFGGTKRSRDAAYQQGLQLLNAPDPLSDITREFSGANLQAPKYSGGGPDWLQRGDADRIMKQAYREAIELAQDLDLPIETFWITGASEDFEMHVCQGSERVTVFVSIPDEDVPEGSTKADTRSWVFSTGQRGVAPGESVPTSDPDVFRTQVSGAPSSTSTSA